MGTEAAPTFTQSVDHHRAHTLLTQNPKFSGSLKYRYDDTGEVITAPNVWYNQTGAFRVEAIRADAQTALAAADRFERCPPFGTSEAAAKNIARRYQERADRIHAEADRMELAFVPTHPVASAHMPLDYGSNVGMQ